MDALTELPDEFKRELEEDADTIGALLHGSRAHGLARRDSDYDVLCVVSEHEYQRRKNGRLLFEMRSPPKIDVHYQSPSRLRRLAANPGWWTATYANALVVLDKSGEIAGLVADIVGRAGERAYTELRSEYDEYLSAFVRSLKARRCDDELGGRLHAAESCLHLLRAFSVSSGSGRRITTLSPQRYRL